MTMEKVKAWHGSPYRFDSFDPKYMNHGVCQYGSGFYFTDSMHIAKGYTDAPSDRHISEGLAEPTVYGVELTFKKALKSDQYVELTRSQIEKILYLSPELEDALWDYGDWATYGKPKVIEKVLDLYAGMIDPEVPTLMVLNTISNDFFRDSPLDFSKAVEKVIGYDMIISETEYGKTYVALLPEQIDIKSRTPLALMVEPDPASDSLEP